MSETVKLATPWATYYKELCELFKDDPAVRVAFDTDAMEVKLLVDGTVKAEALTALMPGEVTFGNVKLKVTVIPANIDFKDPLDLFKAAFDGNPALSYTKKTDGMFAMEYVVFKNKVVQFFNDNLQDINGNESTLFEDIAREVFPNAGVCFCTDAPLYDDMDNSLGRPIRE